MSAACLMVTLLAGAAPVWAAPVGEVMHLSELPQKTHVHGIAVDREHPSYLLIATHHGLYRAAPDGTAQRVSVVQDFMGFTPHPKDPRTLYASGHPPKGGNLGFIASTDKGVSWSQVSPGLDGPVDFHQMTISPADPNTVYGAYRVLQLSRDGGKSWLAQGTLPEGLIDLAASATATDTIYAATETGLLVSTDAGKAWRSLIRHTPVSLVEVLPDGRLFAFVLGRGLVQIAEDTAVMTTVTPASAMPVVLHLAAHPGQPKQLYAATGRGVILFSQDGGRSWEIFGAAKQ